MSHSMPSRGHAMRESSGPGSAEAMDLLDSIYPSDVQRVGLASSVGGHANGADNEGASADGPGGLVSVPENQQLSHAQFHQESSRDASPSLDLEEGPSRPLSSSSRGFNPAMLASEGWTQSLSSTYSAEAVPDVDVFGPTTSAKPPTRRNPSSSSTSRRDASDSTPVGSRSPGIGKPLPGLPYAASSSMNAEDLSLPVGASHIPTLDSALSTLGDGPSSLPPQHIPRPIHTSPLADVANEESGMHGTALVSTTRAASSSSTPSPRQNRREISKDTGYSMQSPMSPPDSTTGRTLAESNRSSIDDIRRLHAQRAARNLELATSTEGSARPSHRSGATGQRPLSVIEPRSRDAAMSTAATMGSSSRDSAYNRPKSSDGARGTRSGMAAPNSATIVERERESEREKDRDRDRNRDRERDRDRERRTRRTLGDYALGKTLGAGSMGKVKLGVKMGNGEKVAIKIIPRHTSLAAAQHAKQSSSAEKPVPPPTASFLAKAAAKDHSKEVRTIREGSLQLLLHHPYVCGMREMIIHPNHYYMIFEYVNGGQMLDYIISHGRLRERAARKFARQIGSALEYCHRNSIVHRDLKIENILISKTGNIKIIDFGLSNLFSPHSHLSTFCGSLYFAAPELLNAKAYMGPEVDVWSFGIVLYVLVCGKVPFDDQSMPALHAKIKKGQVEYPAWLSGECKHILSRMLVTNPQQRATLPEILAHPWMVKGYDGAPNAHLTARQPLRPQTLDPEVIKGMTGFEFGTPEDIESRLLEILTGEAYQTTLQTWDAKRSSSNALSASSSFPGTPTEVGGSSPLGRAGTRGSVDSKAKSASKRFSGIDFYRKKISTTSLFGSKDDSALNGPNGALNGNGSAASAWPGAAKEPLDPTRGFHPLISIYYLVSEKMEREKLYGHSFFASSNVSLTGQASSNAAQPLQAKQAATLDGAGAPSSMPTAADIPQEALRVPEISHVTSASRREGPIPALPAPPTSARSNHSAPPISPTPVFDSREKSQPLPIMAGPPRARAQGDEVEAALRDKGYGTPVSTSWNPAPSSADQRISSARNSMNPSAAPVNNHRRSLSLTARGKTANGASSASPATQTIPQPLSQKQQPPPPPLEKERARKETSPDKRRGFQSLMSPLADAQFTSEPAPMEGSSATSSTPQGSSLVRRFGSLMGRSPSTPVDLEGREKRRQARMSTGAMAPTPSSSRRGSMQAPVGALAGVQESKAREARAVEEEEEEREEEAAAEDRLNQFSTTEGGALKRSGTVQDDSGLRRDGLAKGTTSTAATVGRASGNQLASLGAVTRPSITSGLPTNDSGSNTAPAMSNGHGGMSAAQAEALFTPRASNKGGAHRSSTVTAAGTKSSNAAAGNALTERDRDMTSSKPVFLKGLFSVQTTTTKPRAVLHADLLRVFDRIGLQYRELKGGYECVHLPSLDFSSYGVATEGNVFGRGNARITAEEELPMTGSGVGISSRDYQNGESGSAALMKARRKPSRISFVSSKRDKQRRVEGSSQADSGSIGSLNNASASIGEDLHSKGRSRSCASSITAHTGREADHSESIEHIRNATPSKTVGRSPRVRTDSLGAPSFMQSPNQSPVQVHDASPVIGSTSTSSTAAKTAAAPPQTPATAPYKLNATAMELAVRFEIYVVKVPLLLGVNGLQFRRISGNPWQYQQLARRVLQELKL